MGLRFPGGFKENYYITQLNTTFIPQKMSTLMWSCNSSVTMADAQPQKGMYTALSRSLLELPEYPIQ